MQRNKSFKSHSKSTSSQYQAPKLGFRTIIKRRNDTMPASQLYEDNLNTGSRTLYMSRSQILETSKKYGQSQKKVDIREYVKQMCVKKKIKNNDGCLQVPLVTHQNIIKTGSLSESRLQSLSQSRYIEKKAKRTIEELEQKIQNFVDHNMNLLKMQRKNIGLSQWQELKKLFQIDKQVQNITTYFNELKSQLEQDQVQNQKLSDLNKKIEIIETLLASQSVQSQLLKLQYFGSKIQRENTSSFSNKNLFYQGMKLNKENKSLNYNRDNIKIPKQIMPLSSTTKDNFKKPNKNAYQACKQKKKWYDVNRQPLPRSSYSAQYLNYGYIPTYSYKPDTVRQSPQTSLVVKASTYQQEYKGRLESLRKINFKELDCFKDKFKTSNISFMNSCKKSKVQLFKTLKKQLQSIDQNHLNMKQNKSQVLPKSKSERGLAPFMSLSCMNGFYKTQAQKQFNLKNTIVCKENEAPLISVIKDRKLDRLKEDFKKITRL